MIYPASTKLQCAVFTAAAALVLIGCATKPQMTVKNVGFENAAYGAGDGYDFERQTLDWDLRNKPSRMGTGTTEISADHAHTGARSLKVIYPANTQSVKQAAWALPAAQRYSLQYAVRFEHDFAFNGQSSAESGKNGGKLPGLAGRGIDGSLCSGGMNCANGGGFTARLMWRTNGQAVLYLYDHTKSLAGRQWGENFAFDGNSHFIPGQWHIITQTVQLNTAGQADGFIELSIDGRDSLRVENRMIVAKNEAIDTVLFSTFFGGNSQPWFPATAQTAYFDDFIVTP